MTTCPFCAEEIKPEAIVCPHCGREIAEFENAKEREKSRQTCLMVIAVLTVLAILLIAAYVSMYG